MREKRGVKHVFKSQAGGLMVTFTQLLICFLQRHGQRITFVPLKFCISFKQSKGKKITLKLGEILTIRRDSQFIQGHCMYSCADFELRSMSLTSR